jgi:hypothetical protein
MMAGRRDSAEKEAAVAMQQHGKHVSMATEKHETTEEPQKRCFLAVHAEAV